MNAQTKIDTGVVDIRGKQYQTVALRVQMFRDSFPDHTLATEVVHRDAECVVMRALIADKQGRTLATGHAEENRKASQINRTSALENAETSAIGRALAAFGFGGTEFATANEVQNAIHQQNAGGHSQEGAVSPRHPDAPPKSHLDAAEKRMVREIESCGDGDMLDAYLATKEAKADYNALNKFRPEAIHGPAPEGLDGFVPIADRIKAKRDEFALAVANHMADLART